MDKLTIIGLGLIGSSIALAAKEKFAITAFDSDNAALQYAVTNNMIHHAGASLAEAVQGADIVIIATPPQTLASITQTIAPHLKSTAIVSDVASVKCPAVAAIVQNLPRHIAYIPAHPIAGSEKSGITAGTADLFTGKKIILCPNEADLLSPQVAVIKAFWEGLGAKIHFMPPEIHDLIYGYVSHLPQIIAFAIAPLLVNTPISPEYTRFTRLTHSPVPLWVDILHSNAEMVLAALDDFTGFLTQIQSELTQKPEGVELELTAEIKSLLLGSIASNCLAATASLLQEKLGEDPRFYAGSGFADMTALAHYDTKKLLEQVSESPLAIASAITQLLARIAKIKQGILNSNDNILIEIFNQK